VLVLAVVHDLRDRRVVLSCDLDEVEVLAVGVLTGLVGGLDAKLRPVVVDQTDVGDADGVVDARRVPVGRADVLYRPASGPQRQITKLGLLLLVLADNTEKPLHAAARSLVRLATRLNPAEPQHQNDAAPRR